MGTDAVGANESDPDETGSLRVVLAAGVGREGDAAVLPVIAGPAGVRGAASCRLTGLSIAVLGIGNAGAARVAVLDGSTLCGDATAAAPAFLSLAGVCLTGEVVCG